MYRHFLRDRAAARLQQREWERAVKHAARAAEFISKPCPYCGVPMTMPTGEEGRAPRTSESLDHIVPRSKGGRETVVVCVACNHDKHHLSLAEYRAVLCVRRRCIHLFHYERIALEALARNALFLIGRMTSI